MESLDDGTKGLVLGLDSSAGGEIYQAINRFVDWKESFGDFSQDHYDFWASRSGQLAKSLYYREPRIGIFAVAPLVFLDSFFPYTRRFFSTFKRFPIADAHFSMGYAYLYKATGEETFYRKSVHFLERLKGTRCSGYEHYCWGYPFDWMTNGGLSKKNTPFITSVPYVYEAFETVYGIDGREEWLNIMHSIAKHVACDYRDVEIDKNVFVCSYNGTGQSLSGVHRHVVNANAYRAFMLSKAALRFDNEEYRRLAEGNLNYVLKYQESDGSWLYASDGTDSFIDHFHTCFVLKNLIKLEQVTDNKSCCEAIERGVGFYLSNLVDKEGLPKPFAKTQRVTLFRRELYDYAESINLSLLCHAKHKKFACILRAQLGDLLSRWQKKDGSFRTRQLLLGWNNVPYHRWAQAQLFRSLNLLYLMLQKNDILQSHDLEST